MSEEDKHSKTEEPTGKRRGDALKDSGPPRSRDLNSTITLLAGILTLYITGRYMLTTLEKSSREILANMEPSQVTPGGVYGLMLKFFGVMGLILGPFLITVMVAGVALHFAQGEASVNWSKMAFKFESMNPISGFKRLFNKDAVVEMVKSSLKITIVGYIAYRIIHGEAETLTFLGDRDLDEIFSYISRLSFRLIINSCGVLLILAILDLFYVRWRFTQNIKMTKEEVKQENKDSEGDPQLKGKIRSIQFAQARRRMQQIIPTADVVVTNPTHYAVALKYDRERMAAPFVIAKGADHMAQRIKEIAREHKIVIAENRFLARELYDQVKEGQEIPESLYAAVAEILAYVFSMRGKM
jgi:flagellar biosynthetic protein FlhB